VLPPRRVSARQPSPFLLRGEERTKRVWSVRRPASPALRTSRSQPPCPGWSRKFAMNPLKHRDRKAPRQDSGTRRLRGEAGGPRCRSWSMTSSTAYPLRGTSGLSASLYYQHQLVKVTRPERYLALCIRWTCCKVMAMLIGKQR